MSPPLPLPLPAPARRYPFLLVDRVLEWEYGKHAVGYKCVTINDNFFPGHFPQRAIMPGAGGRGGAGAQGAGGGSRGQQPAEQSSGCVHAAAVR